MTTRVLAVVFVAALVAGTITDAPRATQPRNALVLSADFHVHASPGDGLLPVWEIQREAERRGLDVIAITNHNHQVATRLARALGLVREYPIVIDSQELTTPGFHMAAVGAPDPIDSRLPAAEAIAAIQRQGGVAIAAHPVAESWRVKDPQAILALDGAEAAHPSLLFDPEVEKELRAFYAEGQRINPDLAPIGSSDFHAGAPIAPCRTYLVGADPSAEGVIDAVRRGQTVATCPGGRITGSDELVNRIREYLDTEQPTQFGYGPSTWIALTALIALGAVVLAR